MAITLVQTATGAAAVTSGTVENLSAFGSNTTSGNAIIVAIGSYNAKTNIIASLTDIFGNTYKAIVANYMYTTSGGDNSFISLYYAQNIVGGASHVVTVNFLSAAGTGTNAMEIAAIAREYSGLATYGPLDVFTGR